jgi:hypothetical protein
MLITRSNKSTLLWMLQIHRNPSQPTSNTKPMILKHNNSSEEQLKSDQPGQTTNDLSSEQRLKIAQLYAAAMIDQMDMKMLEQFAFDVIVENMESHDPDEMFEVISFDFGEEMLNEWIADVIQ